MTSDRETELMVAYRHYTECGIIVHPLQAPKAGDRRTGKSPLLQGWNERKVPYTEKQMESYAQRGCNLGIVCGDASDVTVLDIDWYRKGIMDDLLGGLDHSKWCTQRHGQGGKGHLLFKYAAGLCHSLNHELGFDILGRTMLRKSNNCVCAPSLHADGTKYEMNIDISERTEMPAILVNRLKELLNTYDELKEVLLNCRFSFRAMWGDLVANKDSEIYHRMDIFRVDNTGRQRSLALFAELKANGATHDMLVLVAKLIFGDDYDERLTAKELSGVSARCTMTNAKIAQDLILGKYYNGATFDPFTAPLEKLEAKLNPESMEAYQTVMMEAPEEVLDVVRRAFLIGAFTKNGYVHETAELEQVTVNEAERKVSEEANPS